MPFAATAADSFDQVEHSAQCMAVLGDYKVVRSGCDGMRAGYNGVRTGYKGVQSGYNGPGRFIIQLNDKCLILFRHVFSSETRCAYF